MFRVEPLQLFSIPVFTLAIDGFVERRDGILRRVLELEKSTPSLRASNQHGFHSARNLHTLGDPDVDWLAESVRSTARRALRREGGPEPDLVLSDLWAMVLGVGGWSAPHHHFPYAWSGVAYVSVNESVGTDRSDRAGKLELENPILAAERFGHPSGVVITPRDGLLVLFPGSLRHFVHPVRSGAPRVSVSFNLSLRGTDSTAG